MVQHGQPRPRPDRRGQRAEHRGGFGAREGQAQLDQAGASGGGNEACGLAHRAVAVVEQQDLVAGRKSEAAQHGVAALGGVADEGEPLRIGVEMPRQGGGSGAQRAGQFLRHEAARLRLHPAAPARLLGQDAARRGAEGAMVHGEEAGLEHPLRRFW